MADGEGRHGPAALALRLAGASFSDIAGVLALADARTARNLVEETLAREVTDPTAREKARTEMSLRLERLLRGAWAKATTPDHPEHLPAGKFALAVVDRLIRLHGLDAPGEVVIHTPTLSEIDQWVARVNATQVDHLRALEATVVDEATAV